MSQRRGWPLPRGRRTCGPAHLGRRAARPHPERAPESPPAPPPLAPAGPAGPPRVPGALGAAGAGAGRRAGAGPALKGPARRPGHFLGAESAEAAAAPGPETPGRVPRVPHRRSWESASVLAPATRGPSAVSSGSPASTPDPLEPGPGQASDRPPGPGVCPPRRRSARGLGGCTRKQAAWRSTVTCRLGPEAPSTDRGTDRWPPGGGRVWTELAILLDFAARSASVLQAPGRSVPRSHPSPHGSWGSPESCCPRLQPVPPPESEPSDPILRTPRQLCLFLFGCLQHSPKFPLLLCPLHPPPLGAP